ncbi:class II aldolase/adducin family protein [bacterium]|nr:class II aldolase/adducin family protein [bacterium]
MIEILKNELIEYGKLAGVKNFTPGFSGNLSARYGENIVITATGSANGYLDSNDFALIDFSGNVVDGIKKPSSEKMLHVKFYEERPDINYIFHVHSPYLTAFSAAGVALDKNILAEIVYCFGHIPLAEYALPGSQDLVNNTSKYFKDYDVVLMANHGVIVGGKDVKETYLKLELCEAYAQSVICSNLLGGAKILSEDEVEKIYSLRQK